MKRWIVSVLLGSGVSMAIAADQYVIDARHTYPVFEVKHFGLSTQRGRFDSTSGSITLDTAAKKGSLSITINTSSLSMGAADWDKHMKSEDFFNTAQYPTMVFKSDTLVFSADNNLSSVDGSLTLLGVTKPVKLAVHHFKCAPNPMSKKMTCGAEASATLKRSEFGMTKYLPGIGDDVKLLLNVEAVLKD